VRLRNLLFILIAAVLPAANADLILHNGKIVTVDAKFTIHQALAVKDGRIAAAGASSAILASERGAATKIIDLAGKTVLPGLIDAHVHALDSGLSEFRGALPPLDSIAAIQKFIREKARTTPKGEWIIVPRTLPPRLKEMRFPTKADLDVSTDHPVAFDGSYVWGANTMALKISGITRATPNPPGGEVVKGADGEPNGILRNASQLLKGVPRALAFSETDRLAALERMLRLYLQAGLTAVGDRAVTPPEAALFEKLKAQRRLPIRVVLTWRINSFRPVEEIVKEIETSPWTSNLGDEWLKFNSFKVTLDGGQSVGTAYQRMPYGPFGRQLYGQTDPTARGTLFIEAEKLYRIFSAARRKGWQLTAHAQGGGAIDAFIDALERLDKEKPIAPTRSHLLHASFQSLEAIARMKRLGIQADVQPGWLHYDAPALSRVFGESNMRYFYPLRTYLDNGIILAGGSDHMLGYDGDRAVNPYNPFFNMWQSITRKTTEGKVLFPEEAITREEALKMHTIWAAWVQFSEKERGSIERGKLADFVVTDRDFLTCPVDDLRVIKPVMVFLEGKLAWQR
jgi:predicted amidohydrolase YtcJ